MSGQFVRFAESKSPSPLSVGETPICSSKTVISAQRRDLAVLRSPRLER